MKDDDIASRTRSHFVRVSFTAKIHFTIYFHLFFGEKVPFGAQFFVFNVFCVACTAPDGLMHTHTHTHRWQSATYKEKGNKSSRIYYNRNKRQQAPKAESRAASTEGEGDAKSKEQGNKNHNPSIRRIKPIN